MVNGYVATDASVDDQTRNEDLFHVDDPLVLASEWARYASWRARERLGRLIDELPSGIEPHEAAVVLASAVEDVTRRIDALGVTERSPLHHYE